MAKRVLPPVGPVVPVKGRPGIVPGKAPVVVAKRKKLVPVPDPDEPGPVVVARTRRPGPPLPPPPTKKPPPGPAARRTAMQALKAGKVAF
jgi:hypothetical protein